VLVARWGAKHSVSLGFDPGGKRLRRKVSGKTKTKTEVKDKLRELHSDLDAGVQTSASYTVGQAVTDWMRDGPSPSRLRRDERILRPVLAAIGSIPLHALRTHDVRRVVGAGRVAVERHGRAGAQLLGTCHPARRVRGSCPAQRRRAGEAAAWPGRAAVARYDRGAGFRAAACGG
jgi:hypothetical protein